MYKSEVHLWVQCLFHIQIYCDDDQYNKKLSIAMGMSEKKKNYIALNFGKKKFLWLPLHIIFFPCRENADRKGFYIGVQ